MPPRCAVEGRKSHQRRGFSRFVSVSRGKRARCGQAWQPKNGHRSPAGRRGVRSQKSLTYQRSPSSAAFAVRARRCASQKPPWNSIVRFRWRIPLRYRLAGLCLRITRPLPATQVVSGATRFAARRRPGGFLRPWRRPRLWPPSRPLRAAAPAVAYKGISRGG
jgi:hypothetical protein